MMLLRCFFSFVLALAGSWGLHASQNANGDARDVRPEIVGVWRGHSECVVKDSPCHDEVNVYRFSKIAGQENAFSVTASKVVDGKEVVMGTSEWKYDDKEQVLKCQKPSIRLNIHGDKMEGALKLADGTAYRWIYLKKES